MHALVGTDSVHTTAAACDYLADRATTADAVTVVAVASPDDPAARRDAEEALNVAGVRLFDVGDLETTIRAGDPAEELLEAAAERDVDELVIGARGGRPGATADVGDAAQAVLTRADRPVVVVPVPEL
ncbi:universal stress protein [Natronobeatus ordinarius]|uniref:universal stress protein n=1 Tax=Natronobeatus ordinarius TaxID=2963433 RepID=UPI0020CC2C5D|nr:universal stress protein [Natronobeatus ordinarius]